MAKESAPVKYPACAVSRTNIYFKLVNKTEGRKLARKRYGLSLSGLCNRLIEREIHTKGGLLHALVTQPDPSND